MSILAVLSTDESYFFAVLESQPHEVQSIEKGSQLGTSTRYTPTTCFLTFPLPWSSGWEEHDSPQYNAIQRAGKKLHAKREVLLYPKALYKVGNDRRETTDLSALLKIIPHSWCYMGGTALSEETMSSDVTEAGFGT